MKAVTLEPTQVELTSLLVDGRHVTPFDFEEFHHIPLTVEYLNGNPESALKILDSIICTHRHISMNAEQHELKFHKTDDGNPAQHRISMLKAMRFLCLINGIVFDISCHLPISGPLNPIRIEGCRDYEKKLVAKIFSVPRISVLRAEDHN